MMEKRNGKSQPNDLYTSATPFWEAFPEYDIDLLPLWIQKELPFARVYGHKNKCIILSDGRKYHIDNHLNDMTGKDWTLFIQSVFSTRYPTSGKESFAHSIRKVHPSPKPPQLMRDIIEFFTKPNELVFDCFMGVGGTLLGAALCSRQAAGIELNPYYINKYEEAATQLGLTVFPTMAGDSLSILKDEKKVNQLLGDHRISLLLIDPPYSNMMSKEKTGAAIAKYGKQATPFTNSKDDLGNMDRTAFLSSLKEAVELILPKIKAKGYIIIFIKDIQPSKKTTNLLHAEVISKLNEISNIYFKGLKIWCDESTKLYPYGYPFSFVANQKHQYIIVFRKEK